MLQLIPGASFTADSSIRVNGAPSNTMTLRVEGQDATNGWSAVQSITQPSVDAIQEMAVQTSNYAAEYGQVGGGLFNVTMKSGTNTFHGTGYEYFVNEALNAGVPFTSNGNGSLHPSPRPPQRLRLRRWVVPSSSLRSTTATTRSYFSFLASEQFRGDHRYQLHVLYAAHGGVSRRRLQQGAHGTQSLFADSPQSQREP